MATENLTEENRDLADDLGVATAEPAAETAAPAPRNGTPAAEDAEALAAASDPAGIDLLLDVNLKVTVELGRTRMKIRDILNLASGAVVPLEKQASEPVDIMVNGALLATGEVVVVDDQFGVRITKLLNRVDRIKKLG